MEKTGKKILVTGATGNQGGAVARALHKAAWPVRAMTRDPAKPAAKLLSDMGIEVVKADYDDPAALKRAVEGCHGVFGVQNFWEIGVEGETRQGKALADAAKAAGVRHFIYSSVGGAERETGIPHFESKWEIERHIRRIGINATVFRPVFFMYNFSSPFLNLRAGILDGTLRMPMRQDRPLQMLAVEDLAGFVTMALDEPAKFEGKAIELAGDELTMPRAAEVFTKVVDRPVKFIEMPMDEVRKQSEDMAKMFRWFNEKGYQANIGSLRQQRPELMTLEQWLRFKEWHKTVR